MAYWTVRQGRKNGSPGGGKIERALLARVGKASVVEKSANAHVEKRHFLSLGRHEEKSFGTR